MIITDRGLPDLFVYLEEDEARAMLSPGEEETMRYDYALFLEDAGREHFETAGRVERDYAEALALSARTREVWERFTEGRMLVIPPAPQVEKWGVLFRRRGAENRKNPAEFYAPGGTFTQGHPSKSLEGPEEHKYPQDIVDARKRATIPA